MADRPTTSTSRAHRPRTRSRSVHIASHLTVASKVVKPRTKSTQRALTKGKGAGKGKKTTKKVRNPLTFLKSSIHQQMPQQRSHKSKKTM